MRHLTDEEIQSYLQSCGSEEWKQVEDHLNTCTECRNQLLLYERIGDIVLSTTRKLTPGDFEKAVMKRVKRTQRHRRTTDLTVAAMALVGVLIAVSVILLTPQIRQVVSGFLNDARQKISSLTVALMQG